MYSLSWPQKKWEGPEVLICFACVCVVCLRARCVWTSVPISAVPRRRGPDWSRLSPLHPPRWCQAEGGQLWDHRLSCQCHPLFCVQVCYSLLVGVPPGGIPHPPLSLDPVTHPLCKMTGLSHHVHSFLSMPFRSISSLLWSSYLCALHLCVSIYRMNIVSIKTKTLVNLVSGRCYIFN